MNTWEQSSFSAIEIHNSITNGTFVVPPYQRGVVWSKNQKDQFAVSYTHLQKEGKNLRFDAKTALKTCGA